MEHFPLLPVEDEVSPSDPCLRENFIERVLVFRRWKDFMHKGGTVKDLISFHTDHKLLVFSHSPKHYRTLGALVATAREFNPEHLHPEYLSILTEGLRMHTTVRKNTNALQRINWVFQRSVNAGREKKGSWR